MDPAELRRPSAGHTEAGLLPAPLDGTLGARHGDGDWGAAVMLASTLSNVKRRCPFSPFPSGGRLGLA